MNISKINCTPISPKMISFGDSELEEKPINTETPDDEFAPSAMTEDEKLDKYKELYNQIQEKAPKNTAGNIASKFAAIGLTAASFAVIGTKLFKKILPDVKIEKCATKIKDVLASEGGLKRTEDIKGFFARLTKRLEGKKGQSVAASIETAVSAGLDKLKNLDPKKMKASIETVSKAAGGITGGVVAMQDKDKNGRSDLEQKVKGAVSIVDKAGDALQAIGS